MSGTCVAGGSGGSGGGNTGGGNTGGGGGGSTDGGTDGGLPNGETCDQPQSVTTATFSGTTIGKTSDLNLARDSAGDGCNNYSAHPGADVVYKVTVPARSRIQLSLQGMAE